MADVCTGEAMKRTVSNSIRTLNENSKKVPKSIGLRYFFAFGGASVILLLIQKICPLTWRLPGRVILFQCSTLGIGTENRDSFYCIRLEHQKYETGVGQVCWYSAAII